ncbi:MAG: hypothetical protein C4325_12075, partial [Blastocatellia bacterium]
MVNLQDEKEAFCAAALRYDAARDDYGFKPGKPYLVCGFGQSLYKPAACRSKAFKANTILCRKPDLPFIEHFGNLRTQLACFCARFFNPTRRLAKCKALFNYFANLLKVFKCIEEVYECRIGCAEFALERVWFCLQQFCNTLWILKLAGNEDRKSDVVAA